MTAVESDHYAIAALDAGADALRYVAEYVEQDETEAVVKRGFAAVLRALMADAEAGSVPFAAVARLIWAQPDHTLVVPDAAIAEAPRSLTISRTYDVERQATIYTVSAGLP